MICAKVATSTKSGEVHLPRKCVKGGGSDGGAPKKGWTTKYCKWCKADGGSFTMHNTIECCKFDKDGKPKDMPAKPFDSGRKPRKKGGRDSRKAAYLTEKMEMLGKKL